MNRSSIGFAWALVAGSRKAVTLAVFWRTVFQLLPMQVPVLTGALIDALHLESAEVYGLAVPGLGATAAGWIAAFLLAVALAQGVTAALSEAATAALGKRLVGALRLEVVRAWQAAPAGLHRRFGAGDLLTRSVIDTAAVRTYIQGVLVEAPSLALRLAFPAAMLLVIAPGLALIPLAVLPIQWLLTHRAQGRLAASAAEARAASSALTTRVKEHLDGIETAQSLSAEGLLLDRIEREAATLEAEETRTGRESGRIHGAVWALTATAYALCWWQGGLQVLAGSMSLGDLVSFTGFVRFLNLPLRRLTRLVNVARKGVSSLGRVREVLDASRQPATSASGPPLVVGAGRIVFERVNLASEGHHTLRDLSVAIEGHRLTVVAGGSGAGKSSLLHVVVRLADPTSGRVLIDGQEIRTCSLASLRAQVVLLPQHPFVFTGTLEENLRLANPCAAPAELADACAASGLSHVVTRLPLGFQTAVGTGGRRLSGGEAQRLALARALLRRPRILLLDEPTASLDAPTAEAVLRTLQRLASTMTIVLVSHHLSTAEADAVIHLHAGRVVSPGAQLAPLAQAGGIA